MSKPTREDAALMLQFAQWANGAVQNKAYPYVWGDDFIADFDEFTQKHSRGSKENGYISQLLSVYETLGTLYKLGLFNEELLFEWQAIYPIWDRLESHALGRRKESGDPRIMENFEFMAKKARERKP